MAIAALYDIHGNLPALEAVLRELRQHDRIDELVVGGDVTLGPMPDDCLEALDQFDAPTTYLLGNCETALIERMRSPPEASTQLPPNVEHATRWVAACHDDDTRRRFERWPRIVRRELGQLGTVLFCHATPRDENELFTERTADAGVVAKLEVPGADPADVVICGHTHMQFDRTIGRRRVLNAGSVGMPFGEPGAYWLLIDEHSQQPIELERTEYDLDAAAARVLATDYPDARTFARELRRPRSRQEMLSLFDRAIASG